MSRRAGSSRPGRHALAGLLSVAALAGCGGSGAPGGADGPLAQAAPPVVGLTVREAEAALARASLRWRYEGSNVLSSTPLDESTRTSGDDATVVRQSPSAGAEIGPGGVVVLVVSCSPPPGAACV